MEYRTTGASTVKLFTAVIDSSMLYASVLVTESHCQTSLTFVSKAGAYPSKVSSTIAFYLRKRLEPTQEERLTGLRRKSKLLALPLSIRISW